MQRTPNTPTKIASTPTKTASTPNIDLRGFVARQFFVPNLSTFLAYNLQATKCGGVQKMTNIRYGQQLPTKADCKKMQSTKKIEKNLELFLYFWMTAHYFPTAAEKSILQKNGENAAAGNIFQYSWLN